MYPQLVGELVEVTVGTGQQVLRGHRGAFPPRRFRATALRAAAGTALVCELREVGTERVGVGVAEPRQWAEVVTSGAAQPLRKYPGRDTQVGAVFGE